MINLVQLEEYLLKSEGASFFNIVRHFSIPPRFNKEITMLLNLLVKDSKIEFDKKENKYFPLEFIGNFEGKISITLKGYGFIEVNETESFFIPKFNLNNALDGDQVVVDVYRYQNRYKAIVRKIIKRKRNKISVFVSENQDSSGLSYKVEPINENISNLIIIDNFNPQYFNHFLELRIKKVDKEKIFCELIEDLGNINIPYKDIDVFIKTANVSTKFSEKVKQHAQKLPTSVEKLELYRKDDRKKLVYTIDGEKTKDFDDAIYVSKKANYYELIVYIADVAHYVENGDPIDEEALKRSTSIYLIDKVIPMLPEELSNGICSLNPNVDRNTLAIRIKIDFSGNIINSQLFEALINSKYRLTYNEVNNYQNNWIKDHSELYQSLFIAQELAFLLEKNKEKQGYIDFEISTPIIMLDENGKTKQIKIETRGMSEKLIESFMILANEQVAQTIFNKKIVSTYRIHEYPSDEKIESFQKILNFLNLNINLPTKQNSTKFYSAIKKIKELRFDDLIKISLLKTMQKAKYSSENIGHFGLASEFYTHFTSPIRRYPDLIVHRIIKEIIFRNNHEYLLELKNKINLINKCANEQEELAVELERKITSLKLAQFYENKLGQVLKAKIVSIKKFGMFVEFSDKVNALVSLSSLEDGPYELNQDETIAQNLKNKKYLLGQDIKVKISKVDYLRQKIDAIVV